MLIFIAVGHHRLIAATGLNCSLNKADVYENLPRVIVWCEMARTRTHVVSWSQAFEYPILTVVQLPHRLQNTLKCVEWHVKPCSVQSNPTNSGYHLWLRSYYVDRLLTGGRWVFWHTNYWPAHHRSQWKDRQTIRVTSLGSSLVSLTCQ